MDPIYRTAIQSVDDPLEFVMSDETVDRYGDVISAAGWKLAAFKKNPIALFNHDADKPIGTWESVRVEAGKLIAKLKLAAEGSSEFVDAARELLSQRVLRAVSVGFLPLKKELLTEDSDEFWGPFKYLQCELLECSLVSVPANPNALQVAKALGLSAAMKSQVFRVSADDDPRMLAAAKGVSALDPQRPSPDKASRRARRSQSREDFTMSTLAERIEAAQAKEIELKDALAALVDMDDDDMSDDDRKSFRELPGQIKAVNDKLKTYQEAEQALGLETTEAAPTPPAKRNGRQAANGHDKTEKRYGDPQKIYAVAAKESRPADMIVRHAVCSFLSFANKTAIQAVHERVYQRDEALGWMIKAAVDPAMTEVPTWAQELTYESTGDFLNLLMPASIYAQLSTHGWRFTFGQANSIRLPARQKDPNVAGKFIAEGEPIPVRRLGLTSVTMRPTKMAVISTFTKEMAAHSTPQIEGVIRQAMVEDTTEAIDAELLSTTPASMYHPGGFLDPANSTDLSPASADADPTKAMIADMKTLIAASLAINGGRDIVMIMNPMQGMGINFAQSSAGFMFSGVTDAGQRFNVSFIQSTSCPVGTVISLDAADFASATGDVPNFDVSEQATLHMEDTDPAPIVGGDAAAPAPAVPTRSLWQTASIGVRMLWDINWAMRRNKMIFYLTDVTW